MQDPSDKRVIELCTKLHKLYKKKNNTNGRKTFVKKLLDIGTRIANEEGVPSVIDQMKEMDNTVSLSKTDNTLKQVCEALCDSRRDIFDRDRSIYKWWMLKYMNLAIKMIYDENIQADIARDALLAKYITLQSNQNSTDTRRGRNETHTHRRRGRNGNNTRRNPPNHRAGRGVRKVR